MINKEIFLVKVAYCWDNHHMSIDSVWDSVHKAMERYIEVLKDDLDVKVVKMPVNSVIESEITVLRGETV